MRCVIGVDNLNRLLSWGNEVLMCQLAIGSVYGTIGVEFVGPCSHMIVWEAVLKCRAWFIAESEFGRDKTQ